MSYPVDQIVALAKANGQFVLKLAEIARMGGEEYMRIGSKVAAGLVDDLKDIRPGTVPAFQSGNVTGLIGEIDKSRDEAVARMKSAFVEWEGACKDALSQVTDQQKLMDAAQVWFQPLLKMPSTGPDKAKAPTRTAAKTAEAA